MTNPLIARFANEPALLAPGTEDRFRASLDIVMQSEEGRKLEADSTTAYSGDNFWLPADDWRAAYRPYVVQGGILHIPVKGVLLHNFPWQFGSYATGYDYILRAFMRGVEDYKNGAIKGIALVTDSCGGMVAGCFDAVDKMVAAKKDSGVPVRTFAHESAYSAAYAVGCVGDHIAVSRTGGVGSVGVVTAHLDMSKMLDKMGLSVTFIFAGKHKVDGNSYEALPDDVKARIQERIDELYAVFVTSVAENRGLEEQAVRDTEALCFTASQAVSNGFADSVGALDDALADFSASLDDQSDNTGEEAMADEANGSAVDQAALNAAREEGQTAGHAAGVTEGGTAMQTRIAAILGSDEAKGREGLANHFAFKTAMSAEDAIAALAESPKAEADEGGNTPFDNAMSKDNPDVGAGEGGNDDEASSSPIALARAAGIRGVRPAAAPAK